MQEIMFKAELNKETWEGTIELKERTEHFILANITARGSEFTVAISCYYDGQFGQQWCMCVPNWDFGCKLALCEQGWNEEQIAKYIKNKVDRRSLSSAVQAILDSFRMY